MQKPLADLLRPITLDDVVGQSHLLDSSSIFRRVIETKRVPNMVFYGPPGTGKTTIANIIANSSSMSFFKLNGTSCSIDDIKKVIEESKSVFSTRGILLYLDELQYLNKKQQQSLLEYVESGDITLIASTTENPYFYIYPALLSRCTVFEFKSINANDIKKGLIRAIDYLNVKVEEDALELLAKSTNGDMRKALNNLDFIASSIKNNESITLNDVNSLIDKASFVYDKSEDRHFDHLSALMKSLRGSDPDAAVFYLAKMLEAGDLIAVCRRILCSANEDVGLAFPNIIPIVKAAVDTALQLGMPEARLPLTNAVILIATAPKSNSSYVAYDLAVLDIKNGKGINIPRCLQNNHFDGDDSLKKGQNYLYPHSFKNHYVEQQYLPDDLKGVVYYKYQDNKYERSLKEYWDKIKK